MPENVRGRTVALLTTLAVLYGCSQDAASPSEEPAGPEDQESGVVSDAPVSGTCWTAPEEAFAFDFYFDDLSQEVPCDEPHTTQTVSVLELDSPTPRNADRWGDWCVDQVSAYVNIRTEHWVPFSALLYLPSKEQVADGASWLRCDSGFPTNFASTDMQRVDFTHKNAAQDHAEQLQACLDRPPTVTDQSLVDCAAPHAYESTGRVAALTGLSAFPSAGQLRRAERQCREGLPPEQSSPDFETVASWDAKEQFQSGRYFGVCFVHRTDGSPMD
ncbi:septum formation family protein [Nocardioides terrigena]|uniref:septum formation family protein n=1 Tax=Nocardioides terrigena TaxID=424797 RepID=UPI00131EF500|nr:septum formation family protein [Nocardioides terrigena]